MGKRLDAVIAVLNGAVGDYLARTHNGLATEMELIHEGRALPVDRADRLAQALPTAGPRVAVLVHGLMCTEDIWRFPDGGDYGAMLARDLDLTPLYVRYNSGLAIAENGAALDALLGAVASRWPVPLEEIVIVGYSMGGLVARAACHAASLAGRPWLDRVRTAIYVGTPHQGAPLERAGRVVTRLLRAIDDPYTRLAADLAELRSDGVKDLGDADLRHEDRARAGGFSLRDPRHPVPLLASIRHHLVAGSLFGERSEVLAAFFGDAIVPLRSATHGVSARAGDAPLRAEDVRIVNGLSHLDLPHHASVYAHVLSFLQADAP